MNSTLKEILLYVMVYGYMVIRGRARVSPTTPKRVLVWQMAKLGDMVCTTPMFHALKKAHSHIHVTVVGNFINKQVLEGNSDVDEYIVFNGFLSTLRLMRSAHYDAAFVTAPSTIAIATLFLGNVRSINAPRIMRGDSPYETVIYRALLPLVVEHPHHMHQYAPREYLRLLEGIGISTDDTTKHLSHSMNARRRITVFLREHDLPEKKFVVLSPSAGNKIKRWPPKRFARVAEHLVAGGWPVVVIGGSRDREEVADMMRAVTKVGGIVNTIEQFSLDELKALVASASLFISVDTGPIYIAEAFGVPTVDITGPIDEREQPPIGPYHLVVTPPEPRTSELFVMDARSYDATEAIRQTESITVDMVLVACRHLLSPTT